jgi:hypothetical protein
VLVLLGDDVRAIAGGGADVACATAAGVGHLDNGVQREKTGGKWDEAVWGLQLIVGKGCTHSVTGDIAGGDLPTPLDTRSDLGVDTAAGRSDEITSPASAGRHLRTLSAKQATPVCACGKHV